MNCPRCKGQMHPGRFVSDNIEVAPWDYRGWHCLLCGTFIDPVILINRRTGLPVSLHADEVLEFPLREAPATAGPPAT
jgi:hypothetical protein